MSDDAAPADLPVSLPEGATAEAFRAFFGEPIEAVFDLATWHPRATALHRL